MADGQRRLNDLRKTRKHVPIEGEDDDGPYKIDVWVVKLNDTDHGACLRAADAAKARTAMDRKNRDSEQWQAAYGTILHFGDDKDALIELLSHHHVAERADVIQAEVAGSENTKWGKDGYLEGLINAWKGIDEPGLELAWHSKDDDPETLDPAIAGQVAEAERVFAELQEYEDAVTEKLEAERARFVRDHDNDDLESLRVRVVERQLDEQANRAWMRTFERAKIYYSVRAFDDHRTRYFTSITDVDDLDVEIRDQLARAYREISAEGLAGKGSPGPQSSSPQSGSSGEEETSAPSGPTSANV